MAESPSSRPHLVVGIGDIHGRFLRLQQWMERLCRSHALPIVQGLSVGDVEAFRLADDHRRKATKRGMPAEFAAVADRPGALAFPLAFVGGNNEDFETLAGLPEGGRISPGLDYLGRSGVRELGGLKVAFLSGIHAPRFLDAPLVTPRDIATRKQAGYFRRTEVERVRALKNVDLLLLHEWPRGLGRQRGQPDVADRELPVPWMGNPMTRALVEALRPAWVLCGHTHRPWAAEIPWGDGTQTRVACLDELTRPETSLLWLEVEGRTVRRVGWGLGGRVAWEEGGRWGPGCLPNAEDEAASRRLLGDAEEGVGPGIAPEAGEPRAP